MSERFSVVTLDELGYAAPGQAHWHTVRTSLGVQAFGINAWTATEDDRRRSPRLPSTGATVGCLCPARHG